MKIQMICVGKIKETYLRELIDHYTKIIRKKYNFEIIELPDEKTPDNASDKEESKIKEIEGQRILDKIPEGSFVIPLCIEGTPYSTEQFQKKWDQWNKESINNITFIIGGTLGISSELLNICDEKICFSKMTFPHQLIRIFLLEQLFRSFKILNGETYHR